MCALGRVDETCCTCVRAVGATQHACCCRRNARRHSHPDMQQQALLLCCERIKGLQLPICLADVQVSTPSASPARTPSCSAWAWRQ